MKQDVYDTGSIADRTRVQEKPTSQQSDADKQELMRKFEAAGTPGAAHKALEPFVGSWKAEVKCWMEPGGAPNVSQGTAKAGWILNGRFLEEVFHGEMMGKPFRGRSLIGYDNLKQKFTTAWVDDLHTSMTLSEGKADNSYKVFTLEGKMDCAMTGQTDIPFKQVFRILSPDRHVLEMFNGDKGENIKTMEITYTRQ